MNMTAAQYQRWVDDQAELEIAADKEREVCRACLMNLKTYHYHRRIRPWAKGWEFKGDQDINDAMSMFDDDIEIARNLLESNPAEAMRMLDKCREQAVDFVISHMDFEQIVMDQNDEGLAA